MIKITIYLYLNMCHFPNIWARGIPLIWGGLYPFILES